MADNDWKGGYYQGIVNFAMKIKMFQVFFVVMYSTYVSRWPWLLSEEGRSGTQSLKTVSPDAIPIFSLIVTYNPDRRPNAAPKAVGKGI